MARSVISEDQVLDTDFLAEKEHEGFHNKNAYIEILRELGKISVINEWLDSSKTHKISSTVINRSGNLISKTIKDVYDYETGSFVIATVTGTINRYGRKISSISYERNND
jgi:hypothetical protein